MWKKNPQHNNKLPGHQTVYLFEPQVFIKLQEQLFFPPLLICSLTDFFKDGKNYHFYNFTEASADLLCRPGCKVYWIWEMHMFSASFTTQSYGPAES